jgi:Domain of unknown function (DUF4288)
MAFIPANAGWFVAQLVFEIKVGAHDRNIVHRNLILVRASSPEEAHSKAIELGTESAITYENPAKEQVRILFRGVSKLAVLHDPLEHGAELLFEESVGVPEQAIRDSIPSKESLSAFRSTQPSTGPDYSSREILEQTKVLLRKRENQ